MSEDRSPPHSIRKSREHLAALPPLSGELADAAVANILKRTPLLQLVRRLNPTESVDGMAKTILEHEVPADDGETKALEGMPLLWIHCDVHRFADADNAGVAGRRVGEMMERAACGTVKREVGPRAYGLTDHPERMTVSDYWSLDRRVRLLQDAGFPGPYVLAHDNPGHEFKVLGVWPEGRPAGDVHFVRTPFVADTNELAARTEVLFDCSPGSVCVVESLSPRMVRWEDRFDAWYKVVAGWTLWIRERGGKVGVVHTVLPTPAPASADADAPLKVEAA